ncbi:transposase, IS4 family [Candidatus Magnetoovum chiemensis]|nr:transposase, IS4 family [Candidatus Magnetoovum chiemensis]
MGKTALFKAERILTQKRNDKDKIYSINYPEVECISKGKAHKRKSIAIKAIKVRIN